MLVFADLFSKSQLLDPVDRLLKKLWETVDQTKKPLLDEVAINFLNTSNPVQGAKFLALLPVEHAAKLQQTAEVLSPNRLAKIWAHQPVLSANRVAKILAVKNDFQLSANRVARILVERNGIEHILPPNQVAGILVEPVMPANQVAQILAKPVIQANRVAQIFAARKQPMYEEHMHNEHLLVIEDSAIDHDDQAPLAANGVAEEYVIHASEVARILARLTVERCAHILRVDTTVMTTNRVTNICRELSRVDRNHWSEDYAAGRRVKRLHDGGISRNDLIIVSYTCCCTIKLKE